MADWVIAGKCQGAAPIPGKIYEVRHSRKGTFTVRVDKIEDEWATCTVLQGGAKAILSLNVRYEGETVVVRDTLSYWIERDGVETGEASR